LIAKLKRLNLLPLINLEENRGYYPPDWGDCKHSEIFILIA